MARPKIMQPQAAFLMAVLGGATATILMTALLYLAPVVGLPLLDMPRLIGGLFSADGAVALGLGYVLFFLGGALVMPLFLAYFWPSLPGEGIGFLGAAVKGLIFGLIAFALSGLMLWLLGVLNRLEGLASPGPFALSLGLGGLLVLLVVHLLYGLAVALVAAVPQGISPIDTLGWTGYRQAATDPVALKAAKALNGRPRGYRAQSEEMSQR